MTSPDPKKPSILIADDNQDLAKIMRVVLTDAGFEVHAVYSGKDTLDWLARNTPDVLILDLMMPDVSGFTILRQLRASESANPLPVIVLTARLDPEARAESQSAGANAFVTKPLNSKALVEQVRQALALKANGARASQPDQRPPQPPAQHGA
jgi:DNA-binding response OmpR family regulator